MSYFADLGGSSTTVGSDGIATGSNIQLARNLTSTTVTGPQAGQETTFRAATTFSVGEQVGPTANYENGAITGYFNVNLGRHNFLGDHAVIGFRATLADGLPHFGWIELEFVDGFAVNNVPVTMYQPVRWAYESLPNTPITVIPGPGPAVVLVFASAALATVRRRR